MADDKIRGNGVKVKGFELLHHAGIKQVDDILEGLVKMAEVLIPFEYRPTLSQNFYSTRRCG